MSSRAFLVASNNPLPAGFTSDGETNYDSSAEVVADSASYQLPIFWLSLFTPGDICTHQMDDHTGVLTLVCPRDIALYNLRKHRSSMLETLPGCDSYWNTWECFMQKSSASYFKVDATELWELDPESYEVDLPAAIRWFTSLKASEFEKLLSLASLNYDEEQRTATVGNSKVIGEHLYGYFTNISPPLLPPPLPPQIPPPLPRQSPPPIPPQAPTQW